LPDNHVDTGDDETGLAGRELVDEFGKQAMIERYDLRNVGDGVFG
jgi:hypothetical protein